MSSKFATPLILTLFATTATFDDAAFLDAFASDDTARNVENWSAYVRAYDDANDQPDDDGLRIIDEIVTGRRFKGAVNVLVSASKSSEVIRRGFWRMGRAIVNPDAGIETPEFMLQVEGFVLGVTNASTPGQLFVKVPPAGDDGYKFNSPALRLKEARESKSAEERKPSLTSWVLDMAVNDVKGALLAALQTRYNEAVAGYASLKLQDPTDSERAAGTHPNGLLYALSVIAGQHQIMAGDDLGTGPAAAVTCKAGSVESDIVWNVDETGKPKDQSIRLAFIANPNRRAGAKQAQDALVKAGLLVVAAPVKDAPVKDATPGESEAPPAE